MNRFCLLILLFSSIVSVAQSQLPAGTLLPVMLSTPIDSDKSKPGDTLKARLMQDVPLEEASIKAGSHLVGHVMEVTPSTVALVFDRLQIGHATIAIQTSLRAVASMMEIHYAQLPANGTGGDRGSSELDWVTVQVGGDIVYGRRGGEVTSGRTVVGHSLLGGGVLAVPIDAAGSKCHSDVDQEEPQAMWLFSASACGVYGYRDIKISHTGQSEPVGTIVFASSKRIKIRGGSGLLLSIAGD